MTITSLIMVFFLYFTKAYLSHRLRPGNEPVTRRTTCTHLVAGAFHHLAMGTFKYYDIEDVGGWAKKSQKHDDVILEWSLTEKQT